MHVRMPVGVVPQPLVGVDVPRRAATASAAPPRLQLLLLLVKLLLYAGLLRGRRLTLHGGVGCILGAVVSRMGVCV